MWLAFTTNPHLWDHVAIDGWMTRQCWKRSARSQGCVAVSANTNLWWVGLPGSGSNFCGSPQRKVPGSGISKLRCTSGCYQALRSTVPGLQSDQAQVLWEKATVRCLWQRTRRAALGQELCILRLVFGD